MNAAEVGKKLVSLCQVGKNGEAIETLYHPDVVSVEARGNEQMPAEMRGMAAVMGKHKWWVENHEVHAATTEGPYVNGDRFAVRFVYDITLKPTGQRNTMTEVALYTVSDGKIVREEFFY